MKIAKLVRLEESTIKRLKKRCVLLFPDSKGPRGPWRDSTRMESKFIEFAINSKLDEIDQLEEKI